MYIPSKKPSEIGVVCTNLANELGHHIVEEHPKKRYYWIPKKGIVSQYDL